jgi:hypothetical protein
MARKVFWFVIRTLPVAVLLTLSLASPTWGNEPAEVEALIEQANTYRRQGMDHKALPLMQKAYNLAHTARTAAQLGLVEIALGYWLQAERHLAESLTSTRDPWIHKNRAELERALAGVRASIGEVDIQGAPAGAEVFVNGQLVGSLPLSKPPRVGDGPVHVEVKAVGFKTSIHDLTMTRGRRQALTVKLEPVASTYRPSQIPSPRPIATEPADRPEPGSALRLTSYVMAAAAVAAGGFAVAGYLRHESAIDAFREKTDDMGRGRCYVRGEGVVDADGRDAAADCYSLRSRYESGRRMMWISSVGVALLGGGAVTMWLVSSKPSGERAKQPWMLGFQGRSITVRLRF